MIPHLQTLANRLEALSEYSLATTEVMTRVLAAELGVKPGAWMGAARIALPGAAVRTRRQLHRAGAFPVELTSSSYTSYSRVKSFAPKPRSIALPSISAVSAV